MQSKTLKACFFVILPPRCLKTSMQKKKMFINSFTYLRKMTFLFAFTAAASFLLFILSVTYLIK